MDAITILRSIIEDGFLSDTNMHRARNLLDRVDQVQAPSDIKAVLNECREQAKTGSAVEAVQRFRSLSGCGLREAYNAVTGKSV